MNSGKKQFLVGALAAVLVAGVVIDGEALLAAVNRTIAIQNLPPEIKLGYDLKILPNKAFTVNSWKDEINTRDFRVAVKRMLQLLGDPIAERFSLMMKAGILPKKGNKSVVMRREAFETIFKVLIHLWSEDFLTPPTSPSGKTRFADYTPPKRFRQAVAYLFENRIIQGYLDGRLRVGKPLTNRDCIFLLSRFYQLVSGERPDASGDNGRNLVDISIGNWFSEPIKRLEEAGAFAFAKPESSPSCDRLIALADAAGMVSGILARNERNDQLAHIQKIVDESRTSRHTTRGQLARLASVLVGTGIVDGAGTGVEFPYVDVLPDSAEGLALRRLSGAGVKMGYPTGRFAGDECVTRGEVIGTLDSVVKLILPGQTAPSAGAQEGSNSPEAINNANPEWEFEKFVSVVKLKQARIREIMGRNHSLQRKRSE